MVNIFCFDTFCIIDTLQLKCYKKKPAVCLEKKNYLLRAVLGNICPLSVLPQPRTNIPQYSLRAQ